MVLLPAESQDGPEDHIPEHVECSWFMGACMCVLGFLLLTKPPVFSPRGTIIHSLF